jgi:sec-independent protein translocase protein TatA
MFGLGPSELFIVAMVAILLFGKNLPQVAAKFGRHYRDFRRSLNDIQSQVNFTEAFDSAPAKSKPKRTYEYDDYEEVSAPKFQPPPAPPSPADQTDAA